MNATPQWLRSLAAETRDTSGTHGRGEREEWPVEHVHGRAQWIPTPLHLTAIPDFELSPEGIEARGLVKDAKARARFWVMAFLGALLALLGLMIGGCAHQGFPPPVDSVTLPEAFGGAISETFAKATGFRVKATTIPGLPTIVFGPQDRCVTTWHEGCHRAQQRRDGAEAWTAKYLTQWWSCMERLDSGWASFGVCARAPDAEIECYEVQRRCEELEREGKNP